MTVPRHEDGACLFCAAMVSPGVAWQCAVVRHTFRAEATVSLMDRFQGTAETFEQSFPRRAVSMPDGGSIPYIDRPSFRLRMSESKGVPYLSGFIETGRGVNLLWDIRLSPLCGTGNSKLYRAQARLMLDRQETLFPPASAFLFLQEQPFNPYSAAWTNDPLSAFLFSPTEPGIRLNGRQTVPLPPPTAYSPSADMPEASWTSRNISLRFSEGADTSTPARFMFALSKRQRILTRVGRWRLISGEGTQELAGIQTSVIEM